MTSRRLQSYWQWKAALVTSPIKRPTWTLTGDIPATLVHAIELGNDRWGKKYTKSATRLLGWSVSRW